MTDEPHEAEHLAREVRELLSRHGVRSRDLDPRPAETSRAEDDLARILATPQQPVVSRRSLRQRSARAVVVLAAAAVLAVTLVVVHPFDDSNTATAATTPAVLTIRDGGRSVLNQPSVAASDELERLAALAARTPTTRGPVQLVTRSSWYLSVDERTGTAPAPSVLVPVNSDQYLLPDGTVRAIERHGSPLDSKGLVTDAEGSWSDVAPTTDETFDGPEEGPDRPDSLSDDPDQLARQLVPDPADCPRALTICLVHEMMTLHYTYVLPPNLQSALLAMLAERPDIRFAGLTTDRGGRPADAFVTRDATRSRALILLFDPTTGKLLGSEEVLTQDSDDLGLKAPAVVEFTALLDSRRVPESAVPDDSTTTRY